MTNPDNIKPDQDHLLPVFELAELIEIFGYRNERAAKRALRLGTFPVPTFKLAGRIVAHEDAVELMLEHQREEALKDLRARGIEPRDDSDPDLDSDPLDELPPD